MSIFRLSDPTPVQDIPGIVNVVSATNVGISRAFNNGAVDVSFAKNAIGGTPASYTVTSYPGNFTATGSSSPLRVTGLSSNTQYTFKVTGTSSSGYTTPASATSSSVLASTVPQAPTFNSVTPVSGVRPYENAAVDLVLSTSSGGAAVTSYSVTTTPTTSTITGGPSLRVEGLAGGTSYTFTAIATNVNGNSSPTTSVSVTPKTVPQAPTLVSVTPSDHSLSVAFTPNGTGGAPITSYLITYSAETEAPYSSEYSLKTITATSSPVVITTLKPYHSYYIRVYAVNSEGKSLASNFIQLFTGEMYA